MNGKQEQQALVDRWATLIESRGLSSMALPLLEMVDAFGFLGSQVLLLVEPLMRGLPIEPFEQKRRLLSDPGLWQQLRGRLTGGPNDHGRLP